MATFPGFDTPTASTEAPLEMLAACHIRIKSQCKTLQRLSSHLPRHGSDTQAQQAAHNILRYFDTAAVHHHEDEEDDLFPVLLELAQEDDVAILKELTEKLRAEHRDMEAHWQALRKPLMVIAQGQPATLSPHRVDQFIHAYHQHIALEEAELLPMAQRLLGKAELDKIGQAMRKRRGITQI